MKLSDFTLLKGDNCDLLAQIPERPDVVITSPPFDKLRKASDTYCNTFDMDRLAGLLWERMATNSVLVWQVYDAVSNGDKSCTSFDQCQTLRRHGFKLWDLCLYLKTSMYHRSPKRFYNAYEFIYVFTKGAPAIHIPKNRPNATAGRLENGMRRGPLDYSNNLFTAHQGRHKQTLKGDTTKFPALMPLSLAGQLVTCFAPKRDALVADIFSGAQTTGLAVLERNKLDGGKRRYVGLETAPAAFKTGIDRMERLGMGHYGLKQADRSAERVGWNWG